MRLSFNAQLFVASLFLQRGRKSVQLEGVVLLNILVVIVIHHVSFRRLEEHGLD